MKQFRFTIHEACELVKQSQFKPELEKIFGPACEDTDWHWVTFKLDHNGQSYQIPCVWTSHEETVCSITDMYEWWEKETEIYQAVNPGASAEEIQTIIDLGREILHRSAYYHPIKPTLPETQAQLGKTEQRPEPPPWRPWRGPGMG